MTGVPGRHLGTLAGSKHPKCQVWVWIPTWPHSRTFYLPLQDFTTKTLISLEWNRRLVYDCKLCASSWIQSHPRHTREKTIKNPNYLYFLLHRTTSTSGLPRNLVRLMRFSTVLSAQWISHHHPDRTSHCSNLFCVRETGLVSAALHGCMRSTCAANTFTSHGSLEAVGSEPLRDGCIRMKGQTILSFLPVQLQTLQVISKALLCCIQRCFVQPKLEVYCQYSEAVRLRGGHPLRSGGLPWNRVKLLYVEIQHVERTEKSPV